MVCFHIQRQSLCRFALLFGFSFYIQNNNQNQKGKDFRLRFYGDWSYYLSSDNLTLHFHRRNISDVFYNWNHITCLLQAQ